VIDDPDDALGRHAQLRGEAVAVADTAVARSFVVLGAATVRWVPVDTRGVAAEARPGIDPTRSLGHVRFADAPGERLEVPAADLRRLAAVLVAAEAVGVAERALEMSVAHAKVRQQFGRPIGSFQAVKHRCADMAVRAEVARSVTTFAAAALAAGEADAPHHAHVAKALAVDAALANAADNVQNHGGMGYTWEGDAHLYLKRAWVLEHTFGTRAAHLGALAADWRAP
jgi:alkylation response protein AidB-like acyl-CoA dehydrogenase